MDLNPKLVVFDLDYTLWPFWVDTHVTPPFKKGKDGNIYDNRNQRIRLYKDTIPILQHLQNKGYTVAVASRTSAIDLAESLLELFDLNKFFTYKEIYPGSKLNHFFVFHRLSQISYKDMLFFDDERRNIVELSEIGVTCQFIKNGISWADFEEGMEEHRSKLDS